MPNWCSTTITIHDKPEEIKRIYTELEKAFSVNYLKDDPASFGTRYWLGNLLCYQGMTIDEVSNSPICCRGTVEYLDMSDDDEIVMDTETAWNPMLEPIMSFLSYIKSSPEIIYTAEEPGNELYLTNDPAVANTYYFECDFDDVRAWKYKDCYEYGLSEDSLREILCDMLSYDYEIDIDIDGIIEEAEYEFEYICIHKYEYADIDELY